DGERGSALGSTRCRFGRGGELARDKALVTACGIAHCPVLYAVPSSCIVQCKSHFLAIESSHPFAPTKSIILRCKGLARIYDSGLVIALVGLVSGHLAVHRKLCPHPHA